MKLLTALLLSVLLLTGCGRNTQGFPTSTDSNNSRTQTTMDKAKQTALNHAGLTEKQVAGLRIEYDREDNDYEVEFFADGYEYDYEIDASTGQVLRFEKDRD